MDGFEKEKEALDELGVSVYAASVDSEERAREVVDSGLSFRMGHGVTREQGDALGSWWDERRDFIQPSEFVLDQSGRVLASSYSSSPIARMDAEDVLSMLRFVEARKNKKR